MIDRRTPVTVAGARPHRWMTAALVTALALGVGAGCARFDDAESAPFSPAPGLGEAFGASPAPPPPSPPGGNQQQVPPPSSPAEEPPAEPEECQDPDPAVIATCLEPSLAVAGLPTEARAVVAERDTGKLVLVSDTEPAKDFAQISPDAGKVVALAVSPNYEQDKLVYAALDRGGELRIARIAAGDKEKIVGEGLPRTDNGQAGLAFLDDTLVLAVGREVLQFPDFTGIGTLGRSEPLAQLPDPATALCSAPPGASGLYATTGAPAGGAVSRVDQGAAVRVWSWTDQPRPTGCAVTPGGLAVALPDVPRVDMLALDEQAGIAIGPPQKLVGDDYGRISGIGLMASNAIVGTTTNKDPGGSPVPTDDRAIILPFAGGSADERV